MRAQVACRCGVQINRGSRPVGVAMRGNRPSCVASSAGRPPRALHVINAKIAANNHGRGDCLWFSSRKSDMSDAECLAEPAHGLIHGNFVPPEGIQELRELTRTRKQLSRTLAKHALRIQEVLEDANVKLSTVVSDVLGRQVAPFWKPSWPATTPEHLAQLKGGLLHGRAGERGGSLMPGSRLIVPDLWKRPERARVRAGSRSSVNWYGSQGPR